MKKLSVVLKTSLKTNNGIIIPAGKVYTGEITEFPSWLVSEVKANSSAIDIKEILTYPQLSVKPPVKEEPPPVKEEEPRSVREELSATRLVRRNNR